jgi:competence protein ComEA
MTPLLFLWAMATTDPAAKIDLNQASIEQLMDLPGIGEKKATGIIEQRNKRRFRRITEIMLIRGIGPKLYGRIKDRLLVTTPN